MKFLDWLMKPHVYKQPAPRVTTHTVPAELQRMYDDMERARAYDRQRMDMPEEFAARRRAFERETAESWDSAIAARDRFEEDWWRDHGTPPPGRSAASLRDQRDSMRMTRIEAAIERDRWQREFDERMNRR